MIVFLQCSKAFLRVISVLYSMYICLWEIGCCHANAPVQQSSKWICVKMGVGAHEISSDVHTSFYPVFFYYSHYLTFMDIMTSLQCFIVSLPQKTFFPPATLRIKLTHQDLFWVRIIFCNFFFSSWIVELAITNPTLAA